MSGFTSRCSPAEVGTTPDRWGRDCCWPLLIVQGRSAPESTLVYVDTAAKSIARPGACRALHGRMELGVKPAVLPRRTGYPLTSDPNPESTRLPVERPPGTRGKKCLREAE